jgi:hypothetical protein
MGFPWDKAPLQTVRMFEKKMGSDPDAWPDTILNVDDYAALLLRRTTRSDSSHTMG